MYEKNNVAVAILNGNLEEAHELMKNGEQLSGQYVKNNTSRIFEILIDKNAIDLIDLLIVNDFIKTDIYEYDSFENSIFSSIAYLSNSGNVAIKFVNELLKRFKNINDEVNDQTLLGYCLLEGTDPAIIEELIEVGCRVDYKNNANENFIYQVINEYRLSSETGMNYLEILTREGVDINQKNIAGVTPLMLAAKKRKESYLEILLQNGASANEQDNNGNNTFYYAVNEQFDYEALTKLLEYDSIDFDIQDKNGNNLFCEFLRMMENDDNQIKILEKLIEAGANFEQSGSYYGNTKSGYDWLAEKKSSILEFALKLNSLDLDFQDNLGNTLLHKVCSYDLNYDREAARELYKKTKVLLEAGANPDITNNNNETPLILAQQDNLKIKTVELLMSNK
jgi:ankyrin repeat protein